MISQSGFLEQARGIFAVYTYHRYYDYRYRIHVGIYRCPDEQQELDERC